MINYEFTKLTVEESNKRLKELYPDEEIITEEELSIADIYNYKYLDKFKNKKEKTIGFKRRN